MKKVCLNCGEYEEAAVILQPKGSKEKLYFCPLCVREFGRKTASGSLEKIIKQTIAEILIKNNFPIKMAFNIADNIVNNSLSNYIKQMFENDGEIIERKAENVFELEPFLMNKLSIYICTMMKLLIPMDDLTRVEISKLFLKNMME